MFCVISSKASYINGFRVLLSDTIFERVIRMSARSRKVSLVCYEEPTDQQLSGAIRWAYIFHDKDFVLDEKTGEMKPKKPHYHVYMEFGNPRFLSSIAKDFSLPEAAICKVVNTRSTLAYLTHRTVKAMRDNKHMYDSCEVFTSDDLEFDFNEIVDSSVSIDWMLIFQQPTLTSAMDMYKAQGLILDSLQQFKNFATTYYTIRQIDKEGLSS